jgi:hypothetical protein
MNMGLSATQMKHFIRVIRNKVGKREGEVAASALEKVLAARG